MDAFVPAIPELVKSLGSNPADAHRAAVAITTTDLVSKEAALEVGCTSVSHLRATLLSHTCSSVAAVQRTHMTVDVRRLCEALDGLS